MNKHSFKQITLAITLAAASIAANATVIKDVKPAAVDNFHDIYGKNFVANTSTYQTTFLGNIDAKFTAKTTNSSNQIVDGKFSRKGDQSNYAYDGIGVSPKKGSDKTVGEIDVGEYIDAKFTIAGSHGTENAGIFIKSFTLGLLFDGPEYHDHNEVAQVTATLFGGGSLTYTFTATGTQSGIWSGNTGSFANLSPAIDGRGGIWRIDNPFGNVRVSGLSFTSINTEKCINGSDYTLIGISAVPEPETYAMMLVGLAGIGFVARKKKQA